MKTSYSDAARRHWHDAGLLAGGRRLANADQLYGLAAECALKAVMTILGAETTSGGDISERQFRKHVEELWTEYQAFLAGRRGARYSSPLSGFDGNPFADWQVDQRYAADDDAPTGSAVIRHEKACRACLVALERARSD